MGLMDRFKRHSDKTTQKPASVPTPSIEIIPKDEQAHEIDHITTQTAVTSCRRHNTEIPQFYGKVVQTPVDDDQTLLLLYPKASMLGRLKSFMRCNSSVPHTSESYVSRLVEVDVYANIFGQNRMAGKRWLRVVYECLEGNQNPGYRYPGAMTILVDEVRGGAMRPLARLLDGDDNGNIR